jgi:histidine triad (HIT) family protein
MECLFCKIIAKEVPCYKVFEDENVLAFLDIHPCAKGHTVVIPKKHFDVLENMDGNTFQQIMVGVRESLAKIQNVLKPDATNIGINNGKAAGQAVGHVHWHILPRWEGDGGGSMHSIIRKGDQTEVKEVAKFFL